MRRTISLALFVIGAISLVGCKKKEPAEPANLEDGAYIKYKFDNRTAFFDATLTFTKNENGYKMSSTPSSPGSEEQLDEELRSDSKRIQLHTIGLIFLPPRHRKLGAQTAVGKVKRQRKYNDYTVWEVADRGGVAGSRYYEVNTGLMVGMENRNSGLQGSSVETNIPNL